MAKKIKCTKGLYALVDDEDYTVINRFNWYTHHQGHSKTSYAFTTILGKKIHMARFIVGSLRSRHVIDHVNRNGMDNRKTNLRICTVKQNSYNKMLTKNRYKGVKKFSPTCFEAYIRKDRKAIHIGQFKTEVEAAKAYDEKATELFGEFACRNFSKEQK